MPPAFPSIAVMLCVVFNLSLLETIMPQLWVRGRVGEVREAMNPGFPPSLAYLFSVHTHKK